MLNFNVNFINVLGGNVNLLELWKSLDKEMGVKVRFEDWDHKTHFFVIENFNKKSNTMSGSLDCGEKATFDVMTFPWKSYDIDDVLNSKTI